MLLQLVRGGVQYTENKPEAYRVMFVNASCLWGIFLSLIPIIFYNSIEAYTIQMVGANIVSVFTISMVLWLYRKGQFVRGGILLSISTYLSVLAVGFGYDPRINFEFTFLCLSGLPFICINTNRALTLFFFGLYVATFLFLICVDLPTGIVMSEQEISLMDNITYSVGAFYFVVFSSFIYLINELSLSELNSREQNLLSTQKKLQQANHLKTAFLANMSHEIRTPMNSVIGFSRLLTEENLSNQQEKYANIIYRSSEQLLHIVNDVLDISKIETGEIEVVEETLNVVEMMRDLRLLFLQAAKEKKLALNYAPTSTETSLFIETDAQKVRQILTNLLSNALKFTKIGSVTFGFEVLKDSEQIVFFVQDTGTGISKENQGKIFDRFQQIQSDKQVVKGTGLGLAISKAFAELLNGTLSVTSELNKGTIFRLHIPCKVVPNPTKSQANVLPNEIARECTILSAEDVHFNTLLLQKLLENTPAHFHSVTNGQLAVDFVQAQPDIDLVLMDIKMPVLGGVEAMKQIKEFRPDLPIIALTAFSMNEEKSALLSEGFDGFATKPVQRNALIQVINACLEKKN